MVEGGKYRQRRFTEFVFDHTTKELARLTHAPFFQLSGTNKLNGGVDRKIVPVIPFIAAHPITWETTNQHAVVFTTQVVQKRLLHSLCNEAAGLDDLSRHTFRLGDFCSSFGLIGRLEPL